MTEWTSDNSFAVEQLLKMAEEKEITITDQEINFLKKLERFNTLDAVSADDVDRLQELSDRHL